MKNGECNLKSCSLARTELQLSRLLSHVISTPQFSDLIHLGPKRVEDKLSREKKNKEKR